MDTEKVKQFLIDFQSKELSTYPRELVIKPTKELITSILGARRVGKTSLLLSLIKSLKDKAEAMYVDFEYPEFADFEGKDLSELINLHLRLFGKLKYIFFDEIQSVKNWQKALRAIYESKRYYITITGSSAKLLSRELATELRGRTVSYYLYPLSFRELLRLRGIDYEKKHLSTDDKNKILFEFNNYMTHGGYPQIVAEDEIKELIVRDYKDLVLFRDIVERYSIKNIYIIRRFFEYLIASYTKEISIDKFYNFLKSQNVAVSKKTLYNYLDYFESSLFFHPIKMHKVREKLSKIYLNDIVFADKDKGKCLENLVYLELLRKNEKVYYHKADKECDFILPAKSAIQVTWELNQETERREISGLVDALKTYKLKSGLIITYDQKKSIKVDSFTLQVLPFWQWCLGVK